MSQEALTRIVERAAVDEAFRQSLRTDPQQALAAYDLTVDERSALLALEADPARPLRLDARIAKLGGAYDPDDAMDMIRGLGG